MTFFVRCRRPFLRYQTVAVFGEMHWQASPLMSDIFEAVSPLKMTYCLFARHTIDDYIF
jgi:hypothetical protein